MISKIVWDDKYLLDVIEIDEQHKKLVGIINTFYDILEKGLEVYTQNRDRVLKEIVDYTIYHFGQEETLFDNFGYTTSDFHKQQHKAFVEEVGRYITRLQDSTVEQGLKFYDYLVTWLLSHIGKSDKAWASYRALV